MTMLSPAGDEDYKRPILTVDVVIFTLVEEQLMVALYRREQGPFEGRESLPGGYVHAEEDRDARNTVSRVLATKAGLKSVYVEQLQTFAGRDRDPRGWSASIAYIALVPKEQLERSSHGVILRPAEAPGELPFDHNELVAVARERLRTKGAYSTLPARLLPDSFTLPEMQKVYETVVGEKLDQSSFRRKIAELGAVEPLRGETRQSSTVRRPAQLYRLVNLISLFDRKL